MSRLVWKKESNDVEDHVGSETYSAHDIPNISLKPMEIRTFVIEVNFSA